MIARIWSFMTNYDFISDSASWIWNHIFISWSNGLIHWYQLCKVEPWPIIPLDVIASFIIVGILLYIFWVVGSILAWFGIVPAIAICWILLWIIYFFAIPVYSAMIITTLIQLPKRWQKRLVFIGTIAYFATLPSIFNQNLATWYSIMTLIYILIIFGAIPYVPLTKTKAPA